MQKIAFRKPKVKAQRAHAEITTIAYSGNSSCMVNGMVKDAMADNKTNWEHSEIGLAEHGSSFNLVAPQILYYVY